MFATARHWPLSWARCTQSTNSQPFSLRSILTLSSHLYLGLRIVFSLQVFWPKSCMHFSLSPMRATFPAYRILLDLITLIIIGEACKLWTSYSCNLIQPRAPPPSLSPSLSVPNILLSTLLPSLTSLFQGRCSVTVNYVTQHFWLQISSKAKVKVKLSLCLTKHESMKTYWGVEV